MKIKFLGHSAFLIEACHTTILIDPYLTGNPLAPVKADELRVDYIVLTHAHGDHLGDTLQIAKHSGATVICVAELAGWLRKQGIKTHAMQIGGAFRFPWGRVKLYTALHGSQTPDGSYAGLAAGVVMELDDKTLYHSGDTGLFGDMRLIGELHALDLAMLPIGGNYTMDIEDALLAVKILQPKLTIPMHYNTFPLIECDPQIFVDKANELGYEVRIMAAGEVLALPAERSE